ncbi:hypothetical protein TGRH88_048370 [Toxoplasma gondii]|uniref:Uncharacterized protein n=1 Tax=Toxoplasma gondii TaxID=5811 RepID=A0A7J6JV45_TOXGO|nr:hypothetical protein TGRH88_048370 [Toxoplasma gondii]
MPLLLRFELYQGHLKSPKITRGLTRRTLLQRSSKRHRFHSQRGGCIAFLSDCTVMSSRRAHTQNHGLLAKTRF